MSKQWENEISAQGFGLPSQGGQKASWILHLKQNTINVCFPVGAVGGGGGVW